MRTIRVVAGLLLLATGARAGPVNLRWNACFGDGGAANRAFACNTNLGSDQLVGSFVLPALVDSVESIECFVAFAFAGGTIPAWWEFGIGGNCRPSSLATQAALPGGAASCVDFAFGTRDAYSIYTAFISNIARLRILSPLVAHGSFDLAAGQEYYAFTAIIFHQKTVGAGTCGGCSVGACMAFGDVVLHRASARFPQVDVHPTTGFDQIAETVTWQNGTGIIIPDRAGLIYCPGATAVRRSTWGEVKSLYR